VSKISETAAAFEKAKADVERIDTQLDALKAEREEATERVKAARAAVMDALSLRPAGSGRKPGPPKTKADAVPDLAGARFGEAAREVLSIAHQRGSVRMADYAKQRGTKVTNIAKTFYALEKAGHLLRLGKGLYGPATAGAPPPPPPPAPVAHRGATAEKIIDALKAGPLSQGELARRLKLDDSTVWYHVATLTKAGVIAPKASRQSPLKLAQ
jgi:predicted transcriptional regulator